MLGDEMRDLFPRLDDRRLDLQHAVEVVGEADIDLLAGGAAGMPLTLNLAQEQVVLDAAALALIDLDLDLASGWASTVETRLTRLTGIVVLRWMTGRK